MKKIVLSLLTILAGGAAYALPVGNPADASLLTTGLCWEGHCNNDWCGGNWCDAYSFRFGFYGDYVFNRHLEVDGDGCGGSSEDVIEKTEMYTNAAYLAFNLYDRLDLFATLGATNFLVHSNQQVFAESDDNGCFTIETSTDFSWSLGVRGTLWECGCTTVGAEAQYFYTKPHVKRVTEQCDDSEYPDSCVDAKYREWQIGVGIAHRINLLVPYFAIKYSKVQLDLDSAKFESGKFENDYELFKLQNGKCWGYAVGVSLIDCERASVTVEGRFGDEKAVHVNGQIRF